MAKLTTATRKTIPAKDFAGPDRSYPIEDASHARNALSRVSANGSPALQARVEAAVHRKYPGIGKDDGGKGAQPEFTGARKAMHRVEEERADTRMHASKAGLPAMGRADGGGHRDGHTTSGLDAAMQAHADKMHPVKR